MKTIIIEDESPAAEMLTLLLRRYCPDVTITGVAHSFKDGYDLCCQSRPQLVFCDVQLHAEEGTGLDLMHLLKNNDLKIIFTTGWKDFAADAFRLNAVDYLLKPVNINELMTAVEKARSRPSAFIRPSASGSLHIPTKHGFLLVPFRDIVRCEADGAYTHFYLNDNQRRKTMSVSLGMIEAKLPQDQFFRVHKTHIVNRGHILEYIRGDNTAAARMTDNTEVPISRLSRDAFIEWLNRI